MLVLLRRLHHLLVVPLSCKFTLQLQGLMPFKHHIRAVEDPNVQKVMNQSFMSLATHRVLVDKRIEQSFDMLVVEIALSPNNINE